MVKFGLWVLKMQSRRESVLALNLSCAEDGGRAAVPGAGRGWVDRGRGGSLVLAG